MLKPHPGSAGLNSQAGRAAKVGATASHLSVVTLPETQALLHHQQQNLGNFNSLGGDRQVSWVSPNPRDLGGDPALRSLGSKSASSWHIALLALEECMTKELELTATTHMLASLESDGHLVMLLDSFNQET